MAIGETVLSVVLQVVFDRLASNQVINLFKSSKLDQALIKKLKHLMEATGKLLADAEQKQNSDAAVKSWLDDLKHLFYRAEEIADEIATEAKWSSMDLSPESKSFRSKVRNLIPAFSSSSSFASAVNSKISEVVTQLDHMLSHSVALTNLKEVSVDVNMASGRETTSFLQQDDQVFGRHQEKTELLKFLFSEEAEYRRIGVVAIVGMGGMGKTTLAKLIYNDESLKAFDLKAWVYVSDQFDISRVMKSILQSITGQPYSGSLELEFLHRELIEKLTEKRFLLVLDDIWNENYEEWKSLLAPLNVGAYGSKIIGTTRYEEAASIMRTAPMIRLKPLSDADGWSLFSKHAFEVGNLSSNPHIELLGRRIVDKCQGLPLAIKSLGGLLRSKNEINEWELVLQSSLWDLPDRKCNVAPALRLSYFYLPSHLKRCFSYCAIFPKGYEVDKKTLVHLWMAENFVKPSGCQRIEGIGEDYLDKLLSCSFFERSGNCVVMHDLMHDLAEAMSGDFLIRLEHEDKALSISEKARHCGFTQRQFDGFSRFEGLQEASYLRTFVSLELTGTKWRKSCLSSKILDLIFPRFCCLHTLSISNYEVLELPDSIVNLKQLRYLDVSRTRIKNLPESLCTLCNLQSLLLSGCSHLEQLPADMSRLVSLRHLDISDTTSLRHMPNHMSKLKCLQTLSDFVVGKHCGQGIEELRDLLHIRGKLALRRLQYISSPDDALDVNLRGRECINEIAFEFDDNNLDNSKDGRVLLENLKPHPSLKQLTISNYPGTRFPSWLDTDIQCSMYANIVNLTLKNCKYCWSLPPVGILPSLKYLEIVGMENIEVIGSEFYAYYPGLVSPFPVLQKLVISDMKNWKEWSGHELEDRLPFPCLEELVLGNCPELKGDLPAKVRSLKVLKIWGCESLKSLQGSHVSTSHNRALGILFHLASITKLELKGLKELVSLPPDVGVLSCLATLHLEECGKLKSLRNVRLQTNLESLEIYWCESLESLPEMDLLNNLLALRLCGCPFLKSAPKDTLPTSLQSMTVQYCEKWEFPIPKERMQCYSALEHLFINDIGGPLISFPLGAFPNLRCLALWLRELEAVNIPRGVDLKNLTSLQHLYIIGCRKLKWVGKTEEEGVVDLPAPNLQFLEIRKCKLIKLWSSGDREGLPSQLHSLSIDKDYPNTVISHGNPRSLLMFSSKYFINVGLSGRTLSRQGFSACFHYPAPLQWLSESEKGEWGGP